MGAMLAMYPERKGESAMNVFKVFTIIGDYNKLTSINKEKGSIMNKLPQYLTLVVSLTGTLGVPALAQNWLAQPAHQVIYTGLVAAALILHAIFPSIFGASSDAAKTSAGLNKAGMILLILGTGLFLMPMNVYAQTTTTTTSASNGFVADSSVVALHYDGVWSAGTHVTESYDFYDFGTKKANHVYIVGHELLAPTPGFSVYAGGVAIEPNLATLFKKFNVPADTFSAQFDAALGNGVPSSGGSHISALAGGLIKYRATSQLSWNALEVQWVRYGSNNGAAISTGLSFIFGGK
jgi:hypothetical protein